MPLIDNILKYRTVAVAGLEKNTGKTECVTWLVNRLALRGVRVALTSAGLDGETTDSVTGTAKPEVVIPAGFLFSTSEKHFRERNLDAEILDLSHWHTATGRIVTARAISSGKVIVAGPSHTEGLKELILKLKSEFNCDIILIDGALSRVSQSSPQVAEGMILCTGAAVSGSMNEAVRQTAFACSLINLPESSRFNHDNTRNLERGLWMIGSDSQPAPVPSDIKQLKTDCIYVSGALTDRILENLGRIISKETEISVSDYTKIFASHSTLQQFVNKGNRLSVVYKTSLIAICINPWSPTGYHFDADEFEDTVRRSTGAEVYNIRKTA